MAAAPESGRPQMDADDYERPQGEPNDPALEGVMERTDARIRDWLVRTAGGSLVELETSLAALSAALQHPDAEMREAALYLLDARWDRPPQLLDVCVRLAQSDPSAGVRQSALNTLAVYYRDYGPRYAELPPLI